MGKILDTITVLFKGDTSDLKRKKKEAEDLAAETAKNIKEMATATTDTNTTLETTNKTLAQTENLTTDIGAGIASWIVAAHEASASINEAIGAEKAHQEQIRIAKGLATTKKGADAVENALKGVVKQFATAAFGALTIGEAVSRFKEVVSGTLDLQRQSLSLNIDPDKIDALGRAAQKTGGSIQDINEALNNLSNTYSGLTGPNLFALFNARLRAIHNERSPVAAEALGRNLGFPESVIRFARQPGIYKDIEDIKKVDAGIDEATEKVKLLSAAWSEFRTNVRGTFINFENEILGPLTKIVDFFNNGYKDKDTLLGSLGANANENKNFFFLQPKNDTPVTNFPLTQGNSAVSNHTTTNTINLNVQSPKGYDPDYWARAIQAEIENLQQYHNGPIVG